jgi:hypothetical protein
MASLSLSQPAAAAAVDLFTLCERLKVPPPASCLCSPFVPAMRKTPPSSDAASSCLDGHAQLTPRAGWVRYGLARPESVADHTFRMVRSHVVAPCYSLQRPQ